MSVFGSKTTSKKRATTRRKWLVFERPYVYEPEPYTFKYDPELPDPPRPQPWREHFLARSERTYLLPVSFVVQFADKDQIANNRVRVPDKVLELKESIDREGLKQPAIMTLDSYGKLRYHDGYHRLTAILELEDFTHIPIVFRRGTGRTKAFGRQMSAEAEVILELIAAEG